jgi:hypothetical protein
METTDDRSIACAAVLALGPSACSRMHSTEQRTLSGAAAGTTGGYIYDREKKDD